MVALPASVSSGSRFSAAHRVEETLRSFGPYRFSRVAVRPVNGRLILIGAVPSFFAKSLAYQLARATAADHDVVDSLRVIETVPDRQQPRFDRTDAA